MARADSNPDEKLMCFKPWSIGNTAGSGAGKRSILSSVHVQHSFSATTTLIITYLGFRSKIQAPRNETDRMAIHRAVILSSWYSTPYFLRLPRRGWPQLLFVVGRSLVKPRRNPFHPLTLTNAA
jgi:hypothetical protein